MTPMVRLVLLGNWFPLLGLAGVGACRYDAYDGCVQVPKFKHTKLANPMKVYAKMKAMLKKKQKSAKKK